MQRNVVSVEANMFEKKAKLRSNKRVTIKEEPCSSSDVKLDTLVKTMERMILIARDAPKEP